MIRSKNDILALAPDPITRRFAYSFARPNQWVELEGNENILWGKCRTQKSSYNCRISFKPQKFYCSCKNKLPCRHLLGLLFIYLQQSDSFRITYDLPQEIQAWLKDEQVITKKTVDPEREALNRQIRLKNWEKRMEMMAAGLDDLEIWLQDVIRQGLAELEQQTPEFWTGIAARMVDAKLGSIARRLRLLPELITTRNNWHEEVLQVLGEIYLLLKGFRQMEKLPDPLQKELLNLAGVNQKKEELLKEEAISDQWLITGIVETQEEQLRLRRTWLLGRKTKQWALVLDYVWGQMDFPTSWKMGQLLAAEVIYYQAAYPLRVLIKKHQVVEHSIKQLSAYPNHTAFFSVYAKAIAANPWLRDFPYCVKSVIPILENGQLYLQDEDNFLLPISCNETLKWQLLALSGGFPIRIFGEWTGEALSPLSALVDGRLVELS